MNKEILQKAIETYGEMRQIDKFIETSKTRDFNKGHCVSSIRSSYGS